MKVVIDTNVLVSALYTADNNHRKILDMIGREEIKPCYDYRIIVEYENVLRRPKFGFLERDVNALLGRIKSRGYSVIAKSYPHAVIDENDRAFLEVAITCGAYLITGNTKHYPNEPFILTSAEFLKM